MNTKSGLTNAISSVQLISTGSAEQHTEHRYGSRLPTMWWVMTSRNWVKIPINVYIIEHCDGLVLFDTGLNPAIVSDPEYVSSAIGRFLMRKIFRWHIKPNDSLSSKLEGLGYHAADVVKAIISHLHFDHIGGIAEIPQADLLVSHGEWQRLSRPHPEHDWILREHIELPTAKWRQIKFKPSDDPVIRQFDGSYDVMGDGSMLLLPTPGHTSGSMSMLLRSTGKPPLLLIGDLAYEASMLINDQVPGVGDAALLRSSYAKVRKLKEYLPDLIILPSHDFNAVSELKAKYQRS